MLINKAKRGMPSEESLFEAFTTYDIEKKGYLNESELECFWLYSGLLGWKVTQSITFAQLKEEHALAQAHTNRILALLEHTGPTMLLQKINLNLTQPETNELMAHIAPTTPPKTEAPLAPAPPAQSTPKP
ncbi:hypothetical protein NEDG_01391 [Nematocida displodere]|uniref:EF-hand domain-containing protein n=1 Tax=Nematocida displodere TaxID=1805483 RepID=A0A177EBW7_9MICR|nr:hypothetical protein NEDG_01391 [Nematocida displodere]